MKIDLITNSGIRTLGQEIEENMLSTHRFDIASAFITEEVLELIELYLANNNKQKKARLLTGLYNCFNSKEVLLALQKLCLKYNTKLEINISSNPKFHWRYYYFEQGDATVIYCGSANFTNSGITKSGELVTKFSLDKKDIDLIEHFLNTFNKEWSESVAINSISFSEYRQNKSSLVQNSNLESSIKSILKQNKTKAKELITNPKVRVVFIKSIVSAKNEKSILKQYSNWDKDGFDFLCFTHKADYQALLAVEYICVIYKEGKNYEFHLGKVSDNDINHSLSDGPYFISYEIKKELLETLKIESIFKELSLNYRSRNFVDRTLGVNQSKYLLSNLK